MIRLRRRVALAAALAVAAAGSSAGAADWSSSAFFSQRVDAANEGELDSVTDVGITVVARTPTTSLRFAPGVRASFSSEEDFGSRSFNPRFNGSITHLRPRLSLFGSLSFVPQFVESTRGDLDFLFRDPLDPDVIDPEDPEELDVETPEETTLELRLQGSAGLSYEVDRANSVTLSLDGRLREYPEGGEAFSATRSLGANGSWRRALNQTTGVSVGGGVTHFSDEDGGDSLSTSANIGFDRQATRQVSVSASIGLALIQDFEQEDQSVALTGDLGLTYRGRRTSASIGFAQGVDQDPAGEVSADGAIRSSIGYELTPRMSASLAGAVVFDNPLFGGGGGGDDGYGVLLSPGLSYRLSEDWTTSAGYQLRAESEDDFERSDRVFLQVSRNFALLQ